MTETEETLIRKLVATALATAGVLLVPLIAMQLTEEVNWNLADFAVAGALLFGAGMTYKLAAARTRNRAYRAAVAVAVAASLALVWANLAVGLIGSEDNPANLMYLGVPAVAIVGALMARSRPHGMARAMFAAALALAVVALIALIAFGHLEVVGVNGFFAALFVASAWLFRRAARASPQP